MTASSEATDLQAGKATRREWLGLAVIALPCIVYAMDLTVLNLAVPSLSAELDPSAAELLWIVDVYGFLAAGSLLIMGTLGDLIGRRKLLLIGSAAFGILSLFCRLRAQRRDAHRGESHARHSGRHHGAFNPVAHQQHVPRRAREDLRGQRLDRELLARRHHRARGRRPDPRPFLVGSGVPCAHPSHGASARPRPSPSARAPKPEWRAP